MPSDVAMAMMQGMGWKEGDGLGKQGQGIKAAIKPQKKIDNKGIGARKSNTNWLVTASSFDQILAKLNVAYSAPAQTEAVSDSEQSDKASKKRKEKKEKKKAEKKEKKRKRGEEAEVEDGENKAPLSEEERKKEKKREKKRRKREEEEAAVAKASARKLMYAKRHKAKDISQYSQVDKLAIMGGRQTEPLTPAMVLGIPATQAPFESVVGDSDEEEEEASRPVVMPTEGGFTEDTQVNIYNSVVDKQIKGRRGLGQAKNLTKAQRKTLAISDSQLVQTGNYLQRKFVFGGLLQDMSVRKVVEKRDLGAEEDAIFAKIRQSKEKERKKEKKDKKQKKEKRRKVHD